MSYFDLPTATVVLNPDDDPAAQNSVVVRKWTSEERQRILSIAMAPVSRRDTEQAVLDGGPPDLHLDVWRYRLETIKVCVTSWNGPGFDGRPVTPANVAKLPPDILDQLVEASDRLNQGITDDEKKTFDSPLNGQSSMTSPGLSPDGTPATSP